MHNFALKAKLFYSNFCGSCAGEGSCVGCLALSFFGPFVRTAFAHDTPQFHPERGGSLSELDHQIKATEDFIGRAKKRLLQHDVVINEAQEALQKAESMKREAERLAPQFPRSVKELEQLVEQLRARWFGRSIEEPKFHEIGGDGPPFAEFRGSRSKRVGTIRQPVNSWRRHTDWDGLQAIVVARCSRDGRESSRSCPNFFPGSGQDGVVPFNGLQHGLLKEVPPFRRA